MTAAPLVLAPTDYGNCPECGQPMTADDQLHTWTDGTSDCHEDCCPDCDGEPL